MNTIKTTLNIFKKINEKCTLSSRIFIRKFSNKPELYTDASIRYNKMAIGIWSKYYNMNTSLKLEGSIDSNRGELAAIFAAMLYHNNKELIIFTDSQTSIDLIKGDITCHNKYDIINDSIIFLINNWKGNYIKFLKVKSHSKNIGNDFADKLAKFGTINNIQTFILPDDIIDSIDYNNKDIGDIVYTIKKLNNIT